MVHHLIRALFCSLLLISTVFAQGIPGKAPANTYWGNNTGVETYPSWVTVIASPGGTNGQLQYNNSSILAGFTMAGDCTITVPNIICTKTNGNPLPGGSNGQILYNNAGAPGGFTMAGDCTFSVPNINCLKTNGVAFGPFATQTAPCTIAQGCTSQTTAPAARGPSGLNVESMTFHGDSNYSILVTDRVLATNAAFTAPRTWTLPLSTSVTAGTRLKIMDIAGAISTTNTLTVAKNGGDSGGANITFSQVNFQVEYVSDGATGWFFAFLPVNAGGTGQPTVPGARGPNGLNIDQQTLITDANYTVLNTDRIVTNAPSQTVPRTFTLPACSTMSVGQSLRIQDAGGVTPSSPLTVAANAADAFLVQNGTGVSTSTTIVLTTVGSYLDLFCANSIRWVTKYTGIESGGTGRGTVLGARGPAGLNIDQYTSVGDANYVALATDRTIGYTVGFSTNRTLTLPLSTTTNAGQRLKVISAGGGPTGSTTTLTVNRNAGDSSGVNGLVIPDFGFTLDLISDGATGWFQGRIPLETGGTGATSAPFARGSASLNVWGDSGQGFGNADQNPICSTTREAHTTAALTAPRTWTLPAANITGSVYACLVEDTAGGVAGANTITISRAGADTVNGGTAVTITTANGAYLCTSDGASKWSCQALGAASGGGVTSVTCNNGLTGGTITTSGTCALDVAHANKWTGNQFFGSGYPWVDPRAYGAVGDGATNDGAAFHNAAVVTNSLGGIFYVPPGNYCLSGTNPAVDAPPVFTATSIILQGAGEDSDLIACGVDHTVVTWKSFRGIIRDLAIIGAQGVGVTTPALVIGQNGNAGIGEETRVYNIQVVGGCSAIQSWPGEIEVWQSKMLDSYCTNLWDSRGGIYFERNQLDQSPPCAGIVCTSVPSSGFPNVGTNFNAWAAGTAYNTGDIVSTAGWYIQCVGNGSAPHHSGGGAPNISNKKYGDNITDNDITWQLVAPTTYRGLYFSGGGSQPTFVRDGDFTALFTSSIYFDNVGGNTNQHFMQGNIFAQNTIASVWLAGASAVTIVDNIFSNITNTGSQHIYIPPGNNGDNVIRGNLMFGGSASSGGINLAGGLNTIIDGNRIFGFQYGILLNSCTTLNAVVQNNAVGTSSIWGHNNIGIQISACPNDWYTVINNVANGATTPILDQGTGGNKTSSPNR